MVQQISFLGILVFDTDCINKRFDICCEDIISLQLVLDTFRFLKAIVCVICQARREFSFNFLYSFVWGKHIFQIISLDSVRTYLNQTSYRVATRRDHILLVCIYNMISLSSSNFILRKMDIHLITIEICIIRTAAV